ncbi:endoplasmic reticulum metallopeptidase 1-like [Drosophila navojoa]|uniref:endoplasmic reticulum metallopeptidase 1-like n=1 Tax=Drosophila navojoa TaxID=7232 RepID=UPI000846E630|nr:endoplasmic reticulum metallopeptidase 1-like [Drosophila navojoa]
MADKESLISVESVEAARYVAKNKTDSKLPWYFATGFILFWVLLFFAVVIPFFYRLPTALTLEDAQENEFIAERAYKDLYTLSNIGNKLTGSKQNEIDAVNFILSTLAEIKDNLQSDYFDMEIDLSQVSGAFGTGTTRQVYQGVQNIVVKLTPKQSSSQSYLLVNSHFDSKPATWSAGDAGFMITVMLEVLRVIATTKQHLEHPIVFLFNGAEEIGQLASHGFVTQHKWAPNCKAVVNLDAAGSGGREILFQTGPNHPWLVEYYKKYVKHPFGTTVAEEIFQAGIIPSDTDFRQFRTYGNIPGLDMGQCFNGFVYHTKYDLIDVIPRESFQNTGDNVLSLVRALANAPELYDTKAHEAGHTVYFDFLGLYLFNYPEATGTILNYGVAAATLILIFISMWRMTAVSNVSISQIACWLTLVLVVQVICFVLGLALPLIVAHLFDNWGYSLAYYSTPLLVIGLYVCPSLIGLSLPLTIYFAVQRNDKISNGYHVQLALHAQAILLTLLTIGLTVIGIRSTYVVVIPLIFYVLPLALNLLTTLHDRSYAWTGILKVSQIIPFLYSSYVIYTFVVVLTPMGARAGSASNRDLYISVLAAVGTILSFSFLVPLINTFRRPSLVILALIGITALSMFLASSTQLGFPYRPKTNGQRVAYLHARNIFYEYDGTRSKDESGYLFSFQDRRKETPFNTKVNLTGLVDLKESCEQHMLCGMPLYEFRYVENRFQSKWLPRQEPVEPPEQTTLTLQNKTVVDATTIRFEFSLKGPTFMNLFIQPDEDVTLSDWSFGNSSDIEPTKDLPYIVFIVMGADRSALLFYLEFSKQNGNFDVPLFQLGVAAHSILNEGDAESKKFAASFPSYSILSQWPALYLRYIF